MRNLLLVLLTALFTSSASAQTAPETRGPITFGEHVRLESRALGETRSLNIWLPPQHETAEEPYTVLYLIDGGLQQDFIHIAGLAQLGVLSWQYKPLIVVGIETDERINELTPAPQDTRYQAQFPTSGASGDFRAHIRDEVIPYIETRYRTGGRALIGESLAGLFVIDTLLAEPDLFDDYIAVSPSLWWDDQVLPARAAGRLGDPEFDGRRLYITMADEGGTMQAGLDTLLSALESSGTGLDYRHVDRRESETHGTIFHPAALDALRWLYPYPPYDYGPAPWYLREGGQPDEDAG